MHKYRKEFSAILTSSSSNLTKSRFLRLFIMSLTLIIIFLPCQFYILYRNATFPHLPYSWTAIHGPMWWDVTLIPTFGVVAFDHWIQLAVGYAVFLFFGMGADAMRMYRNWLLKMGFGRIFPNLYRQRLPIQNPPTTTSHPGSSFGSRAHLFLHKTLAIPSKSSFTTTNVTTTTTANSPTTPPKPFSNHVLSSISETFTQSVNSHSEKAYPPSASTHRASWLSRVFTFRFSTPPPPATYVSDVEAQAPEPAGQDYGRFYRNIWSTNRNAATMGLRGGCLGGVGGMKV